MAPLPQNNTNRLWIGYTSNGVQHEFMTRYPTGTTPSQMNDQGDAIIAAFAPILPNTDSFYSMRYSLTASDFSIPLPLTPVPGTLSSPTKWLEDPESAFLGFCGRETGTGRRWRMELFTPVAFSALWPADNRYAAGESTTIDSINDAVRDVLFGSGAVVQAVGIGGTSVTLYTYTNIAKNGYWQRKQRT